MKRLILIISICTSFVIGQTYCAGDQISSSDLNTQYEVCYGSGDYETGDSKGFAFITMASVTLSFINFRK